MTEWGPTLTGPECKQLRLPDNILVCCDELPGKASMWSFGWKYAIYTLPANHPAYKVAEYNRNHPDAPMVYHGGSDEAPDDWERGNDALMRNGDTIRIVSYWTHREHHVWGSADGEGDIIGYVPTPVEEAQPVEESDTVTDVVPKAFVDAILHGDDEHRKWLIAAAEAFNAGNPIPAPTVSDTVTLKRMTEAEWFEASRHGYTRWAHSAGLIREETLLEQFQRETCFVCERDDYLEGAARAIEWMKKRQGDKS